MTRSVREIINYLLPFVAQAGAYSERIQQGVGTHDAKDGLTAFHHALSDADLTIQSYIEVALLAKYPGLSFFCEERKDSLNAKYFPSDASMEVLLDPIDGTRAYIDRRSQYQIICVIHDAHSIVGAICYMPRRNKCYIALNRQGTFLFTHDQVRDGEDGTKITTAHLCSDGPVLVFNRPDLVAQLSPHVDVRDLVSEYELGEDQGFCSTDVLEGRASAIISSPCQAIDGGALAFIAAECGAIVSDFSGAPVASYRQSVDRVLPGVLVTTSDELHQRLLSILSCA